MESKTSNKKWIIIVAICVILIIAVCICLYLFKQQNTNNHSNNEEISSTGTEWGDKYVEDINERLKNTATDEISIKDSTTPIKVNFIQDKEEQNPSMILNYKVNEKEYMTGDIVEINYIQDDDVKKLQIIESDYQKDTDIQYLYNIEQDKYDWYIAWTQEGNINNEKYSIKYYEPLSVYIKAKETLNSIDFTDKEKYSQVQKEMQEYESSNRYYFKDEEIERFNSIFLLLDEMFNKYGYSFTLDMTLDEIRNLTAKFIDEEYKTADELITTEIKEKVEVAKENKEKMINNQITQSNYLSKIGEHLKYFSGCFLGDTYGIGSLYKLEDVTTKITIPNVDTQYKMTYEIIGLNSVSELNYIFQKYMNDDVITKLKKGFNGDITEYLYDYNGKAYWIMGGIGDGASIDYKNAKVLSSENDTTIIQLEEIYPGNNITSRINVTIKYDTDNREYKITDFTVNKLK